MSRVLDKLQARYTGMRSIATGQRVPLVSAEHITEQHSISPHYDEYVMEVRLASMFRCTKADYGNAASRARRMIVCEIYGDVLRHISVMHSIIDSGDSAEMHKQLDTLERLINA